MLAQRAPAAHAQGEVPFQQWLQSLWPEAQALGITRKTFDDATRGLKPNLALPDLIIPGKPKEAPKGQAEFERTPAEYLSETQLARLSEQGRKLAAEHAATLAAIEQRFGVPPSVLIAIWGRETNFGNFRLPHNAIEVLATQAYLGRRKDMFRQEFLLALKILQEQHVAYAAMKASWAGAMGHTQFLPTDFFKYGVDMDGDGHRDIWNSIPDALGSAASQLLAKGWDKGKRWGFEVKLPGQCRLLDRRARYENAGRRMDQARLCAADAQALARGTGRGCLAVPAGRSERAGLPDAEEFLRVQGL